MPALEAAWILALRAYAVKSRVQPVFQAWHRQEGRPDWLAG